MKSKDTLPKRPSTAKEWDDLVANAPGTNRPLTPAEMRQWDNAVVVPGGGYRNAVKLIPISDTHAAEFSHQGPRIFAGMICHGESY